VIGGGPVPVSVVRVAAVGAFVKVAVRDGKKLETIVHYGRSIPAELRTALELGDPEHLDGAVCARKGATGAAGSNGATSIRSRTAGRPATRTSKRGVGRTTGPRPNATARPACWEAPARSADRPTTDERSGADGEKVLEEGVA
jgi:hypothetical protein